MEFAHRLARDLAAAGHVIISGGARGIDGAAHLGALEAGGRTVAVLATGLSRPYPKEHGPLFEWIAKNGALVTEVDDCTTPHGGRFLQRNRLVAALSTSLVVVQAPARSGTLSTAHHARLLARPILAVPSSPWDPRGEGCLHLLSEGAYPCVSSRDVVRAMDLVRGPPAAAAAAGAPPRTSRNIRPADPPAAPTLAFATDHRRSAPTTDESRVFALIGSRPRHADELARRSGLPVQRVHRAVLLLMLDGSVDERAGGRYVRTRRARAGE